MARHDGRVQQLLLLLQKKQQQQRRCRSHESQKTQQQSYDSNNGNSSSDSRAIGHVSRNFAPPRPDRLPSLAAAPLPAATVVVQQQQQLGGSYADAVGAGAPRLYRARTCHGLFAELCGSGLPALILGRLNVKRRRCCGQRQRSASNKEQDEGRRSTGQERQPQQ